MKIFELEKELESKIIANKTVAVNVPYKICEEKIDSAIKSIESIGKGGFDSRLKKAIASLANEPHPDLMYGTANLVSTVMNLNDDLFTPAETWKARSTPVNTPYNDQHIESDIIGHIIASRPLDKSGNEIKNDEIPDYFDIEVDWVVYKSIFPAVAKEIAEKGPKEEKFVSMECTFKDFDYALIDTKHEAKVVARNEDTAFLTKYLKAYGGPGQYKDYRIGRVLKDFRFSGMGSVDLPANPTSTISNVEYASVASMEAIVKNNKRVILYITKGNIMTIENLDQAKTLIGDLEKKIVDLEAKSKTNDTLASDLSTEKEKLTVATNKIADLEKEAKTIGDQLEATKKDLTTKSDELQKIHSEAKTTERVSALKESGVEIDDEKRKSLSSWSDDQFTSVLDFAKNLSKNTKKEEPVDSKAVSEAQAKAAKELENAKENKEAHVENTPGDVESDAKKLEKAAAKLANILVKRKTKSK